MLLIWASLRAPRQVNVENVENVFSHYVTLHHGLSFSRGLHHSQVTTSGFSQDTNSLNLLQEQTLCSTARITSAAKPFNAITLDVKCDQRRKRELIQKCEFTKSAYYGFVRTC